MLSAENYAANLRTAARNAAASAGISGKSPSEWTLAERQTYNRELVRQILAYPTSFSPDTVNIAATMNTDYGLRGHQFDNALDLGLGAAAAGAKNYVQKLGMAVAIGVVLYLAFLAAIHRPRSR